MNLEPISHTSFEEPLDLEDISMEDWHTLAPSYEDIPRGFRNPFPASNAPEHLWIRFQQDWFFKGLKDLVIEPKRNIDPAKALRHLQAAQRNSSARHEHREAAVAYLASLWFNDVTWDGM